MVKCYSCGSDSRPGQRNCIKCHAKYMREWRKNNPLTKDQRFKDNARSYAGVYLRRGKLKRLPCNKCGSDNSEMHHEDYSKPLEVIWLCRACHLTLHNY